MWSARRLRRPDLLAELKLPHVTNIRDLSGEITRRTGRRVILEPRELAPSVCGACAVTESAFHVGYDPRTSILHQDHTIAHEFCHLLLGHHENRPASALSETIFTSVDSGTVQMMLGRTKYDEDEERDTEQLASLLQRQIIDRWLRSDESSGDDVQDRVTHTLLRRREARP
ncbi:hypothetical protein [Streptomyces californicus]